MSDLNKAICPKCRNLIEVNAHVCGKCGFSLVHEKKLSLASFEMKKLLLGLLIIVVGLSMCISAYKMRFDGSYNDIYAQINTLQRHIYECESNQAECKSLARSSSIYFRSLYDNLVDEYQEMIDDNEEKIENLKKEQTMISMQAAIVFFVSCGIVYLGTVFVIKSKK